MDLAGRRIRRKKRCLIEIDDIAAEPILLKSDQYIFQIKIAVINASSMHSAHTPCRRLE